MSVSSSGSVDLESVLNVRRRALISIGETSSSVQSPQYTDTIYLKREDDSNSILSTSSKIVIFGELQFLYSMFERYTSNVVAYEEPCTEGRSSSPPPMNKSSFSAKSVECELDDDGPPIVSMLRHTSLTSSKGSKGSTGSLQTPGSPPETSSTAAKKKATSSAARKYTYSSTASEYSAQNLEGKRYGCIQLPNMSIIEILEVLLRSGLDLVDVSSDFDKTTLHQNFVFSKTRNASQKYGQYLSRLS